MKSILMSIKPQWVEKTLNGLKTTEVRKGTALYKAINKLIEEQGVAPMLIYCTKDKKRHLYKWKHKNYIGFVYGGKDYTDVLNGRVVARFNATAEEITTRQDRFKEFTFYETSLDMEDLLKQSCLDYNELDNYLQGEKGTAIHINDLEIFDKPKEISDFHWYRKQWVDCGMDCPPYVDEVKYNLTRAPQSWCYVKI